MNGLQIFKKPTAADLRLAFPYDKNSYLGFFYILEYGSGVKIGSTNNPAERYSSLRRNAVAYGDVSIGALAVSQPHTNFRENEAFLHQVFDSFRISGTELFHISLDQAITKISELSMEYRDDSAALEKRAEDFCEFAKEFTGLGEGLKRIQAITERNSPEVPQSFTNTEIGVSVRVIRNRDGSILINAEDAALGLGWSQIKNGVQYVKWDRLNQYCASLGFSPLLGKDDFIPEPLFYMLAMKANNALATKFQKWLAFEVLPSLRKTGRYAVPDAAGGTETAQGFISDRQAAGQVSQLIRTLSAVMQRQGQSGRAIAEMAQAVCGQFGIVLPDTFVSTTSLPALPAPTQQSADLETVRDFYSGYDKRGVIPACEVYADYRRWMRENRSGEHPAERHYFGRLWCRVSGLQTRPMSCRGMKGRYYRIP